METPSNERTCLLAPNRSTVTINTSTEEIVRRNEDSGGSATNSSNALGFFAVVFLTVNATLGAGLLNIPFAFSESGGILPSTLAQTFHVVLVVISLLILSGCSNVSNSDSLQAVVLHFCGPVWNYICSLSIFLYSYGACVTYIIIIGDQFDKFFGTFCPTSYDQHWYFSRDFLIIVTAIVTILPLCFSKHISFLKFASFFGFCCTLYLTILIFAEYIKTKNRPLTDLVKNSHHKWSDILNVIPVLTFSYQCQLSWVPTYAQVNQRENYWRLLGMIIVSMLICFASYTWTGVFGLLTFGTDNIAKDIMLNYDPKDVLVSIAMILLIVKTIVVYPVLLFCGRIVVEELFRESENQSSVLLRVLIATIWVLSTCALAILIPNIAVAINYLGSLANLFIFILPGFCLYNSLFDREHRLQNELRLLRHKPVMFCMSVLFIAYGTFIFVISIGQAVKQTTN